MLYTLEITRIRRDVGHVQIEADSPEEALRKYWEPDFDKGEDFIFDCDIDWYDEDEGEYEAEIENDWYVGEE